MSSCYNFFLNNPTNLLPKNITEKILRNSNSYAFHKSFVEYNLSPLHHLPALSSFLKISELFIKDESYRFGLNSFKVLGASYAVNKILQQNPGISTFCSATDGNHGKGLAWSAKKYKKECIIYVPRQTSKSIIKSITDQGAKVVQLDLNYDQTCMYALEKSQTMKWQLVQDTSWENYEIIPAYIKSGYLTHFVEVDNTINNTYKSEIDFIFLQCGVGSWAASCIWYYLNKYGKKKPKIILIEPKESDGVFESFINSKRSVPKGTLKTIMNGLNCGIPSKSAWEIIKVGCDAVLKIEDSDVKNAMKLMYNPFKNDTKITSGESGAAGLAGLIKCLKIKELKKHLGIGKKSKVLVFSTEGDTNPKSFKNIINN